MKSICIPTIEEVINKLKNHISKQDGIVFGIALIVSIVFYFPMLTAWLGNPDSFWNGMVYKNGSDWENRLGRFGVTPFYKLKEYVISTAGSTIFSFFMLAFICVLLRRLFGIYQQWLILSMILFVELTPNVISTLTYYYCSDIYFFAYFLNVAAIYLITNHKEKRYLAVAAAMMAYSLSCYQAYISVAAVVCIFMLCKKLLEGKERLKSIIQLAARYITVSLFSGILYVIVFKALQIVFEIEPAEKVRYPDIENIIKLSINVYRYFIQYFFTNGFLYNEWGNRKYWNFAVIAFTGVLFVVYVLKNRRKLVCCIGSLLCMACFPIACMIIWIIVPGTDIFGETGILMIPAIHYIYLIPIVLLSLDGWDHRSNWETVLEWICGGLCFKLIMLLGAFVSAFQGYLQLELSRMNVIAGELTVKIESEEAKNAEDTSFPVVFAGELPKGDYYNVLIDPIYGTIAEQGMVWSNYDSKQQSWIYFLRHTAGKGYETVSEEKYQQIIDTQEFRLMPVFPTDGSVKTIDDTVVIKLNAVDGDGK